MAQTQWEINQYKQQKESVTYKKQPRPSFTKHMLKTVALRKKDQDEQIEQLVTDRKELKKQQHKKHLKKKEASISNFIVILEDIVITEQGRYVIKCSNFKYIKALEK